MSDATLEDYQALVGEVTWGHNPILPKPEWGQDAAFLAFYIDGQNATISKLERENAELRVTADSLRIAHGNAHKEREQFRRENAALRRVDETPDE